MDASILRNKTVRTASGIVALLLFPFVGFMLANVLFQVESEGTLANWHSLGKPSEGVVNIVGGTPWIVWWEAHDGQIYEGDIQSCRNTEEECWRKSESIDTFYDSEEGSECESAFSNMKSPPGVVLKCLTVIDPAAEWYREAHYALLQDGSIWYWKHSVSGGPSGIIGTHEVIVCGGIFMGLFVGLLIHLYLRNLRKVSPAQ